MSKDPAEISFSHLDLEDLVAAAAGEPADDAARAHLAACEHCRREARRWTLVADGVRSLTAAPPEASPRPRSRRRVPATWRRAALAAGSVAAALVLLVGIGVVAGVVHIQLSGTASSGAALTAVTGCSQVKEADGTLRQADGNRLIVQTGSGTRVTVTTTSSTVVTLSGPLLRDITDGSSVMVHGYWSGGVFHALVVTVGHPLGAVHPAGLAAVRGTVAEAGSAGFALVTAAGTRIPVATSGDTLVVVLHATARQLRPGTPILAVGSAGPAGILSARAVAAVQQLPAGPQTHVNLSVKDCSPASIAAALSAISASRHPDGA